MKLFGVKRGAELQTPLGIKLRFTDDHPQTDQLRTHITVLALNIRGIQPRQPEQAQGWFLFHFKRNLPSDLQDQAVRAMKAMVALEATKHGISSIAEIDTF